MKWTPTLICFGILFTLGLVFVVFGPITSLLINQAKDSAIRDFVIVDSKEHAEYNDWLIDNQATDPLYTGKYYFFNITNRNQISSTVYPLFEELGPYTFQLVSEKIDVEFLEDGDKVAFKWREFWIFLQEESSGDAYKDKITTVNPAYLSVMSQVGNENGLRVAVFSRFLADVLETLKTDFTQQVLFTATPLTIQGAAALDPDFIVSWIYSNSTLNPLFSLPVSTPAISVPFATALFNPANPIGLVGEYWGLWLQSMEPTPLGQQTAAFLETSFAAFGLTAQTRQIIAGWLFSWFENATPALYPGNVEEIPYQQWADLGVTGGFPLRFLAPDDVPFFIEYGAWALFDQKNPGLLVFSNLTKVKGIFEGNGKHSGFTDPVTVGTFLFALQADQTLLSSVFELDLVQAQGLYSYFLFVLSQTIDPIITQGNGGLFATYTPAEYLFGFNDPLLAVLSPDSNPVRVFTNHTTKEHAQQEGINIMYTGKSDINDIYRYIMWENKTEISFWNPPMEINGYSGNQVPPKVKKTDTFTVYSSTLQRQVTVDFNEERDIHGVTCYQYKLAPTTFLDSKEYPENAQFYIDISGFHNFTKREIIPGISGVPLYLSEVHFKGVSSEYNDFIRLLVNDVEEQGFTVNPEAHETFVCIEPISGQAIAGQNRAQVNIQVIPQTYSVYHQVPAMFLPVYWGEEGSELTEAQADTFISSVYAAQNLAQALMVVFIVIGIVLLAVAGIVLYRGWAQKYGPEANYTEQELQVK